MPEHEFKAAAVRLVCNVKNCHPTDLGERDDFALALAFDSLDTIELAVRLEHEYGIEVGAEEGDMSALVSVDALAEMIGQRRKP